MCSFRIYDPAWKTASSADSKVGSEWSEVCSPEILTNVCHRGNYTNQNNEEVSRGFDSVLSFISRKGPSPYLQASNEEEFIARPQKILYSALGLGLIFTAVLGFEKKKVSSPNCGCIMGREKNTDSVCVTQRQAGVKIHQDLS